MLIESYKKLQCKNCGYEKDIFIGDVVFVTDLICSKCKKAMIIENENLFDIISKILKDKICK